MVADTDYSSGASNAAHYSANVVPVEQRDDDAQSSYSRKNVLRWQEYLPEDCINKMCEMGWDLTT